MLNKSLRELSQSLLAREFSSEELVGFFLQRIRQLDPDLHAFICTGEDASLAAARREDDRLGRGDSRPLSGIPYAHKDIFCTKNQTTTCASKMLKDFSPPYDATVSHLLNQQGMVMLGKTNMDEFAMGSSTETSFFGKTRNPWNLEYIPGGSSGGSAAAVGAGLAPCATGSDTGGSVRQPSAFCGITGLKPSYGRISRFGMIAYASSFDQAGVMARSAEDCAYLLQVLAGFDHKDSTSSQIDVPDYVRATKSDIKGTRIGMPKQFFPPTLPLKIREATDRAVDILSTLGCELLEVDLPSIELFIPAYYTIALAECSSNLARYDGVRFGHRCRTYTDLEDFYMRTRSEGFGAEVKRRILVGTFVISAGYFNAYYLKALQARSLILRQFKDVLSRVDILLSPTTPCPAFKIGEKIDDPVAMYLSDVFTVGANLAGLPAISMPIGFDDNHLPQGMQLIGNSFEEGRILALAVAYQNRTDWHRRFPPGW